MTRKSVLAKRGSRGPWRLWLRAGSKWLEVTGLGDADTQGDFRLRYRIEQVSVINSGPVIGNGGGGVIGR